MRYWKIRREIGEMFYYFSVFHGIQFFRRPEEGGEGGGNMKKDNMENISPNHKSIFPSSRKHTLFLQSFSNFAIKSTRNVSN